MKKIKIGGVPEHFNLAWYLTLKDKAYQKEGINLRWYDFFGGTGEMCKALRNKEIDIAVILTEGIIKDIIDGNEAKIVQVFTKSPLIWGVHVANNSPYETLDDLRGKKAAISRFGSGSHLMAYVNAENNGWNTNKDLDFEVIKDLNGALEHICPTEKETTSYGKNSRLNPMSMMVHLEPLVIALLLGHALSLPLEMMY